MNSFSFNMFPGGLFPRGMAALFFGLATAFLTVDVLIYFLVATAFFFMFRKANIRNPWLAYVPIAQLYPFFLMIGVSPANFLWLLVPFVGILLVFLLHAVGVLFLIIATVAYIVVFVRWLIRLLRVFGINPLWLLGLIGFIIPGLNYLVSIGLIVLYCIIGFNANIRYRPPFDGNGPFRDDDFNF